MLTRQEFRMLFGLPKRKVKSAKKTAKKPVRKTLRKKPVRKSAAGKKVVKKTVTKPKSIKLGKKIIGGKARTVYKSRKTGAKYYKKVLRSGAVKRMYLGKPVKKVQKKTLKKKTRFGYVNTSAPSSAAMMGPFPMTLANGSADVPTAAAAFGKKRTRKTALRKKPVKRTVRKTLRKRTLKKTVRKTAAGKKVLRKRPVRKTLRKKPVKRTVRKTLRKRPVKKVVRKSRFGMSHGRPSGLATGPYPF